MVVINGQQFNLTQIGTNKYLNNIKSAKEAQELAQLLRGLDREVTVIKKLGNGCSEQIVFNHKFDIYEQINDTQNPMYGTVDGQKVNFISVSKTDYAYDKDYTADDALNSDYSGTKKQEQMELLNNAFNAAVDKLAEGYVENLTEVYDSFGVSLPENDISQSIKALLEQKKESYRDFAAKNSDYANLNGSRDKWLERDMKYMANVIQEVKQAEWTS